MKEFLELLQDVNALLREERDISGKMTKEMVEKLEGISFRAEANRRRLDMLQQKLNRSA